MALTWDDVSAIARELPQAAEGVRFDDAVWRIGKDAFVWVRPLRVRDRDELGDAAPTGEIIGASTADEGDKLALIEEEPRAFFTTSHFDGYAAILIALDHVDPERLREVVTDAWLRSRPEAPRGGVSRGFASLTLGNPDAHRAVVDEGPDFRELGPRGRMEGCPPPPHRPTCRCGSAR